MGTIIAFLWPFIWKYGIGVTLLVIIGAIFLFSTFKKQAAILGLIALMAMGIYTYGVYDGKTYIQSKWDVAEKNALDKGIDARKDAENEIPVIDGTTDGVPGECLSNDPYDRDCR
tara:strand:+ start:180 stop:524 length:345 start_codon:yes stop_codon:yes gene_type:complete